MNISWITEHTEGTSYILIPSNPPDFWKGFYMQTDRDAGYFDLEFNGQRFYSPDDMDLCETSTDWGKYLKLSTKQNDAHFIFEHNGHSLVSFCAECIQGWENYYLGLVETKFGECRYFVGVEEMDKFALKLDQFKKMIEDSTANSTWRQESEWHNRSANQKIVASTDFSAELRNHSFIEMTIPKGVYLIENSFQWEEEIVIYRFHTVPQ